MSSHGQEPGWGPGAEAIQVSPASHQSGPSPPSTRNAPHSNALPPGAHHGRMPRATVSKPCQTCQLLARAQSGPTDSSAEQQQGRDPARRWWSSLGVGVLRTKTISFSKIARNFSIHTFSIFLRNLSIPGVLDRSGLFPALLQCRTAWSAHMNLKIKMCS
jgi:hypothetical protein